MDAPRPSNVHVYLKRFLEYNVSDLVCVCEMTYDPKEVSLIMLKKLLANSSTSNGLYECYHTILMSNPNDQVITAGITVHEMEYDDGSAPPEEIISRWLEVRSMPLYVLCCPPLSPILLLQLPRTISIPPCSRMHTGWVLLYHVHTSSLSCS